MRLTRPRVVVPALIATALCLAGSRADAQTAAANDVPVTVASVSRQDVPVILTALGTVQPFQTVTVRARVDGTLDKVFFAEGQTVHPGDVLAQLDPRPYQAILDQAAAKRAADQATLENARSDLARYAELANAQIASRQKYEQAKAAVGQGEAAVRGDDATIAAAQLNLSFTRITAPIEGRVGLRLVDPGNFIRSADQNSVGIVTITQVHPITVLFTLPQDALQQVQSAMKGGGLPVQVVSANRKSRLADGKLLTMDSSIDPGTGTIKLKSVFGNVDETLWPGQFVNVQLRTGTLSNVATVPSPAVQRGPDGYYVYLVKSDRTVFRQPIDVTQDDGALAVLGGGVEGGETVVLAGQSRLTNGSRVAVAAPKPSG